MTNYVFLWETAGGKRHWEAVDGDQCAGFLEKLLLDGVPPASIMVAYTPIFFHWVFKKYHKGLSDVHFGKVNEEIMGHEPIVESQHKPVSVKRTEELKYGWIAPDGRKFGCDYGGHSALADRIVGGIEYVSNPERHLEDLGWAKVMKSIQVGKRYAIGMGSGKKLTDEQIKTIEHEGLGEADGISYFL